MADQYVNAVICGVEVKGLKVMQSRFGGFDIAAKEHFQAGATIAFLHSDKLSAEQKQALFPNGRIYNLTIQWPPKGQHAAKPADAKAAAFVPPDSVFEKGGDNADDAASRPEGKKGDKKPEKKPAGRPTFKPSDKQLIILAAVVETVDNILIDAKAGSGKTSTLVWLVYELADKGLLKNKQVVYLAFNKKIEEELTDRLTGTGVPAMTTHRFGFNLLKKQFGNQIKPWSGRVAADAFLKCVCDENGLRYNAESFKQARKTDEYGLRSPVLELVSYIKNWAIFPTMDEGVGMYVFSKAQEKQIQQFIHMYEVEYPRASITEEDLVRWATRVCVRTIPMPGVAVSEIDFDDMLYLPLCLNLEVPKYDMVMTDESQDFNTCQILLLEKLLEANKGCRAIVVGDPKQSLYRFRGADSQAFARIEAMLTRNGRKVVKCELPVNYRCDQTIITNAQRWVPQIQGFNKATGTVGEIMFYEAIERANNNGNDISVADGINGEERSLPLPGKENVSFAFLCRTNVPMVVTAYQLIAKKKRVCIIGRKAIGQPLIDIIEALCGTKPDQNGYTNRIANWYDPKGTLLEEGLMSRLTNYLRMQRAKLAEEQYKNKLEQLEQNVECIEVIAEQVKDDKVSSIIDQINTLFVEEPDPNIIQLSTIHRAKGLEWDVVFILRPDLLPHPAAKHPEEIEQEENACYVAATRARYRLYYVNNWPFGNGSQWLNWEGLPLPSDDDKPRIPPDPAAQAAQAPASPVVAPAPAPVPLPKPPVEEEEPSFKDDGEPF